MDKEDKEIQDYEEENIEEENDNLDEDNEDEKDDFDDEDENDEDDDDENDEDDELDMEEIEDQDDENEDDDDEESNIIENYDENEEVIDDYDYSDDETDIFISKDVHTNLLENNHPLLKDSNIFEVKNKTVILKSYAPKYECDVVSYIENDEDIYVNQEHEDIIIDDNHKTIPILTKYEKARILGIRANQINGGAKPFIDIDLSKHYDGYYIANEELKAKKIPFIIKRPLPSGKCEFWNVRDLEQLH